METIGKEEILALPAEIKTLRRRERVRIPARKNLKIVFDRG